MEFTPAQRQFLDHLQERMGSVYHQVSLRTRFDLDKEIATFPLWNLSGQLKGTLIYNWKGDKSGNNVPGGRYQVVNPSGPVLFGLEWFNENLPYTFVCEGVFDALSLMPYGNAVAVFSNEARVVKQQIDLLPGKTVAVCDGDKAGALLAKWTDFSVTCPKSEDPNSMKNSDLKALLGDFATERDFFQDTFRHWWNKQGILLEE